MGDSEIIAYLKDFDNETKNLKLELMKICWFMRGGMAWQESLNLSPDERDHSVTVGKRKHGNYQEKRSTFLLDRYIIL